MDKPINCIFCGNECKGSAEHVIPDFIGGSLIIRDVCKPCNDKMGSDFEGPVSNSPIFRLARYKHEIQGKSLSRLKPFPYAGTTGKQRCPVFHHIP